MLMMISVRHMVGMTNVTAVLVDGTAPPGHAITTAADLVDVSITRGCLHQERVWFIDVSSLFHLA